MGWSRWSLPAGRVGGVTIRVVADVAGLVLDADRVPDTIGLLGTRSVPIAVAVQVPVLVPNLGVVQHPVAVPVHAVAQLSCERVDGCVTVVAVQGVTHSASRALRGRNPLGRSGSVAVDVAVGEAGHEEKVVIDGRARVAVVVDTVRTLDHERCDARRSVVAILPRRKVHDLHQRRRCEGHGAGTEGGSWIRLVVVVEVDTVPLLVDDGRVGRRAVPVAVAVDAAAVAVLFCLRVDGCVTVVAVATAATATRRPPVAVGVGDRAATRGRGLVDVVVVRGVHPRLSELHESSLLEPVGELLGAVARRHDRGDQLPLHLHGGVGGAGEPEKCREAHAQVLLHAGHGPSIYHAMPAHAPGRGSFLAGDWCRTRRATISK